MTNRRLLFIIIAITVVLGLIFIQLRQEGDESAEGTTTTTAQQTSAPSSWPWYLSRGFGVASFILLFLSAVIGVLMTTGVIERKGAAHFTECPPDYARDEAFQKEYAATAKSDEAWDAFFEKYLAVPEADYQRLVGIAS